MSEVFTFYGSSLRFFESVLHTYDGTIGFYFN